MGVNFGRDTLQFALISKKHLYEVKAEELHAHYQMAMSRLICYAAVDSKDKAKFVADSFKHINTVFDSYIESVSVGVKNRKANDTDKDKNQDQSQPVISVKDFFEQQVLGKMADDKVPYTTKDIINALRAQSSN